MASLHKDLPFFVFHIKQCQINVGEGNMYICIFAVLFRTKEWRLFDRKTQLFRTIS